MGLELAPSPPHFLGPFQLGQLAQMYSSSFISSCLACFSINSFFSCSFFLSFLLISEHRGTFGIVVSHPGSRRCFSILLYYTVLSQVSLFCSFSYTNLLAVWHLFSSYKMSNSVLSVVKTTWDWMLATSI